MITIAAPTDAGRYSAEMGQAWRLRHRSFVEEKGWSDVARSGGRGIDGIDPPQALRLLAMEDAIVGRNRLLPVRRPHLTLAAFSTESAPEPWAAHRRRPRASDA